MDIQHLVDRLEDLVDEGRHIPFSKYTMVDEERALEIIDQMRISIPEEIEKAARVLSQRDRILAQANEEAARIVQQARERSDQMVEREVSVQAAQSRAANVIEQARQEAETMTGDADKYVLEILSKLEQFLLREVNVVRNGINEVNQPVVMPAPEVRNVMPAQQPQPMPQPIQRQPVEVGARHENDK